MCGLMLGLVGCQSGLYQIVTSEDDKELDDRMSYYEAKLVGTKSERVEFEPISSDSLYDSQKMPICVVNGKSKCEPDKTGISSFGWLFTLGIIPMCESGFRMQEITVKTPLGDKNGWYRVDAKRWSGWLPIFIGYPGIADKRAADASVNGAAMSEMLSLARQSAVESLARQFSYDEYVSFAKKANAERGQEIVHIEEVTKHVNELIAKFDFATAERLCEKELGVKRKGSVTGDAVTWKALEGKVAKAKEDHRVDTKKKNLEALLKENKFAEVLVAIEEEKDAVDQVHRKMWSDLWTKTTEARDAFVKQQKEAARAKEVARIEAKEKMLESLMKEKKYEEIIKQCESENEFANGEREGYDASDSSIWKSWIQLAVKARHNAARPAEEARIVAKVKKVEQLLADKKYVEVISLCEKEDGKNPGSLPEDAAQWKEFRTKAVAGRLLAGLDKQDKSVFRVKGFHIGMTFEEAEVLLDYYFPNLIHRQEINSIRIGNKEMCFCSGHGNIVERVNFSRDMLEKLFSYDYQTYRDWVASFARDYQMDFRVANVKDSMEVGDETIDVVQEAYRSINRKARCVLTYFGEKEVDPYKQIIKRAARSAMVEHPDWLSGHANSLWEAGFIGGYINTKTKAVVEWLEKFDANTGADEGTLRIEKIDD